MAESQIVPRDATEVAHQPDQSATLLSVIERAATNPDVDIDKMERLLQMHGQIQTRAAEMEFNSALAEMQCELPEVKERGEIKHGNKVISTYARWEDINREIKPVLQKHGFALSFRVDTSQTVTVEGVLSHRAGHNERTRITLPVDAGGAKNAVQAVASSVSYGKRYVAGALLNLTSSEIDDDGESAGGQIETISDDDALELNDMLEATGVTRQKLLDLASRSCGWQITSLRDIPAEKLQGVKDWLNKVSKREHSDV